MPLFARKNKNKDVSPTEPVKPNPSSSEKVNGNSRPPSNATSPSSETPESADVSHQSKPKLVFHCQQAHGSPTGIISGFTNVKELYQAIADSYEMPSSEILFCTLNTHKVDMDRLLGGQIGLDDFIFAHVKGQKKELEMQKTEDALGLTITDNGTGYCFIKRVREGSIVSTTTGVSIGDHIEKIDGVSMVGKRHFEVAKALKDIPKGSDFVLRLIEPLKSGFANIGAPTGGSSKKASYGTGKETLRLRSNGKGGGVEVPDDVMNVAIQKINARLESFLGISDNDLAQTIWEIGSAESMTNPVEFSEALQGTDLAMFGFSDAFLFELWGDIGDAKSGRLKKVTEFNEDF